MQTLLTATSNDFESIWQEYTPTVAWGTIALGSAISVGFYMTLSHAISNDLPYPVASLFMAYLMYASFTVMHDAGHGGIIKAESKLKPLETCIGWLAALPLLVAPYRLFQKIHDRHHAFTNDPDRDPDHYSFSGSSFGILMNCLWMPFQYHVLAITKLRHIKTISTTYRSSSLYLLFTIGGLVVIALNGYASEVLWFAIIPNIIAVVLLTLFFDYIPHHPHKSRDRYHDTRIYPGRLLNVLLLGQNYHLIHHMYPRLPWYRYQAVYQRILPNLEANSAPIEDISGSARPGFMRSLNANSLLANGERINMVLPVISVQKLTVDAVAVEFRLPVGEHLNYSAGQYITVSKWIEGEQHTRCYSLCTPPGRETLKIGVRHKPNGLVSGFINQQLKANDELIVQGPFGDFTYEPKMHEEVTNLVLIAGGSGITPILSILETALLTTEKVIVSLLYASRNSDSIMFVEELKKLQVEYAPRLKIKFILDQVDQSIPSVRGPLNAQLIHLLLPVLHPSFAEELASSAFYICGPKGLKNTVVATLAKAGVKENRLNVEEFVSEIVAPIGEQYRIDIQLKDNVSHSVSVASNQTLLDIARYEQIQIPHACGQGTCGSCKFKVLEGDFAPIPDSVPGLTAAEKSAGMTLACQCKPRGNMIVSEV